MRVHVIGAGGHAKVVIATLQAAGVQVAALYDDDRAKQGTRVLGIPVAGPSEAAGSAECPVVIAVGCNRTRKRLAETHPRATWASVVHPSAVVHPSVVIGPGVVICAGAVLQPECVVGAHAIVNTGATVDHDVVLGDYVHVGPGVHLAGGVRLAEGVLMGIAAAAVPGVQVGTWTVVGAGAVVVRELPAHVTAVGVPARVHRRHDAAPDTP